MQIASKFVEAGANVIFIQEDILPTLSVEYCEAWASSLAPVFNIIRFYEALPVLQITDSLSFDRNKQVLYEQNWDCILCPELAASASRQSQIVPPPTSANMGIALPPELFQRDRSAAESFLQFLPTMIRELRPSIVTTARDVPVATDIKLLARVWEAVHSLA
jgi:hypothetical protein